MPQPLCYGKDWPARPSDEEVREVLIGGRWIRIKPGTYYENEYVAVFRAEDGTLYEAASAHVQLKVANG